MAPIAWTHAIGLALAQELPGEALHFLDKILRGGPYTFRIGSIANHRHKSKMGTS